MGELELLWARLAVGEIMSSRAEEDFIHLQMMLLNELTVSFCSN